MPSLSTVRRRAARQDLRLLAVRDRSPHAVMKRYVVTATATNIVIYGGGPTPGLPLEDCIRYLDKV